ncbi:rod-determining factor RdfA [Haloplanus halophilus]|uniref:rod-determining factor RdfA n=1 Tax=Haloplanus halophilus TaxID=2949993 RepID=UPI00203B4D86|nr:rod-determining factor RdfA [Haloplanus sp. GDY1]
MAEGGGCKIEDVCARRGLSTLPERLVRRRRAAGDSLRDLERFFNRELLAAAMRAAGMELLDDEAANVYRLLTDDGVSDAARTEATDRLTRAGVDVQALREDFVTYGTVRTHLRECAGVDTARASEPVDAGSVTDTVFALFGRTEAVTERELSRLAETEALETGPLSVSLAARVTCESCGEEYRLLSLVERGGCACADAGRGAGESQT